MSRNRRAPRPPSRLASLLARLVPDGAAGPSSVLGDLHEEYLDLHRRRGRIAADLWYAAQVMTLGTPWAFSAAFARVSESLRGFALDFRASFRGLRRSPVLVLVAVLSLSFGSGLVTATATIVNDAWYAPLPWTDAHRMVEMGDTHPTEVPAHLIPGTSMRAFEAWRTELPSGLFQRLEARSRAWLPVRTEEGSATTVRTLRVSGGYSDLLEMRAAFGRLVSADDVEPGAEPVVVLDDAFWQAAFGASPDVLGRTLTVDGVAHTVVGVLRPNTRRLREVELYLPLSPAPPEAGFDQRGIQVLGLLEEGTSVDAADAALASLASAMYEEADELTPGWSASAVPLRKAVAAGALHPLQALALALVCVVVLLVGALNLASLLLARTVMRTREFGVRAALGAGTVQVARASLMDGLVLAGAGGLLGLAVVVLTRDVAVARFANEMPPYSTFPIDLRVLLAAVVGTTLTAVVVGLFPVLRAVAIGKKAGIAGSATGHSGASTSRTQNFMLGWQIVLALVLVTASIGALRTFSEVSDFDRLGFRWQGLTMVGVTLEEDESGYGTGRAAERISMAAAEYSRVGSPATSRGLNLVGGDREGTTVRVGGASEILPHSAAPQSSLAVGPGYFELRDIPIVAGRPITASDAPGAPPAAVVSSDAARAMWPDRSPESVIGETVALERGEARTAFTVVGVAGPVIINPVEDRGRTVPRLYPSILQTPDVLYGGAPGSVTLHVSTRGVPPTVPEWTAWLDRVLPGAAVSGVTDLEELLRQSVRPTMVIGTILGGLAILVLALVAIGIYGTVSYRIASTRREIGIRLALGADAREVVRAVVKPLVRVVLVAVGLGTVLALASSPVFAAGGLPVGLVDAWTLALVAAIVATATAGASWGPLRRALSIDPSRSLREE